MIDDSLLPVSLPSVTRKKVTTASDGGRLSSEDADNLDHLRSDPALALVCGQLTSGLPFNVAERARLQTLPARGVSVDHSTIYRWVQRYAPEIEKRLRWQWRQPRSTSWRVDETYIKVRDQWAYLYRAVDAFGDTIDFYLSPTRNTAAAKRFLGKTLNGLKSWELPHVGNTDKAPTYAAALAELKMEGKCPEDTVHRQAKYLNNVVETDHGKLKQLIRPVRGFKTLNMSGRWGRLAAWHTSPPRFGIGFRPRSSATPSGCITCSASVSATSS